jgi:integral membrane protein
MSETNEVSSLTVEADARDEVSMITTKMVLRTTSPISTFFAARLSEFDGANEIAVLMGEAIVYKNGIFEFFLNVLACGDWVFGHSLRGCRPDVVTSGARG